MARGPLIAHPCVSVLLHASLKAGSDTHGKWSHFILQQTSSEAPLLSALLQSKTLCFVCNACQCMPSNSGAGIHSLVLQRFRVVYNNTYQFLHYIPRNTGVHQIKLPISSGHVMPWLETICVPLLNDIHIQLFIRSLQLSDAFYKCPFFSQYLTLLYGAFSYLYDTAFNYLCDNWMQLLLVVVPWFSVPPLHYRLRVSTNSGSVECCV